MVNRVLVTSLSIALIPAFCKGAEKPAPKPKAKGASLSQVVKRVMAEGWEGDLGVEEVSLKSLAGFPKGAKIYADNTDPEESSDGAIREFYVVLDPSTTTIKASGLLVRKMLEKEGGVRDGLAFRSTVGGQLLEAVKGFRPSEESDFDYTNLDISTPTVKASFQNEMDFWLKGKGRKKKQPEKKN